MYSSEFFNQRSFEVVWAVFRVAEYVSRPKLRQTLEDRALDYFVVRDIATLDALEETVRLAANIGEIGKTNAGVLLRETGTLRAAILELRERGAADARNASLPDSRERADRTQEPSIDGIFSRPPMLLADFMGIIADSMGKARTQTTAADSASTDNQKQNEVSSTQSVATHESPAMATVGSGNDVLSIYREKTGDSIATENHIGKESGKESGNAVRDAVAAISEETSLVSAQSGNSKRNPAMTADKRHAVIIEQLSRKTYSTLRDVAENLPGVSERTLRYDIQHMVDSKIVERLGGGGPHSFLRLKKGKGAPLNRPKPLRVMEA